MYTAHSDWLYSEYNHTVAQMLVTGEDIDDPVRRNHFQNTLYKTLEYHCIPIINENDTGTRLGWIKCGGGIDTAKDPSQFNEVHLLGSAKKGENDD